jgi:general secretion pathway protein E
MSTAPSGPAMPLAGEAGLRATSHASTAHKLEGAKAGAKDLDLARGFAAALGLPLAEGLDKRPVSHEFLSRVPISFARRHGMLGLAGTNGSMTVVISDLAQWPQLECLGKILGKDIQPLFCARAEVIRAINAAYQLPTGQAQRVLEELDSGGAADGVRPLQGNEDLLDQEGRETVVKLVNGIILEAVRTRASDVHVQPYEDRLMVRFRVDGFLHDRFTPPAALHPEIVSRIKVIGGMNIAEHRLPQDGRATVEVGDRLVDLRISSLPTSFGERVVIRILDKSIRLYRLPELGMPPAMLSSFRRLIAMDHGIILVTGPTGSGKSTTLYAALQELNAKELNILTLEDPIEYRLEGISQTQVSEKKGMTFASGLRNVLRQDPDIIMVGEIRDAETAHMAIQSALTGHLVFSTLHTNDAAGAVARMLDLGVEPYLLASSLLGVLAQRLVRRICPSCREAFQPAEGEMSAWGLSPEDLPSNTLYRGKGCEDCLRTGYRERVGIFELLTASETIRDLILHRAKASSIKSAGVAEGMASLRACGMAKAMEGVTTMEEVSRAAGADEF